MTSSKIIEGAKVAWLHTLHMEAEQTSKRLHFGSENAFGVPGKDYSAEYAVIIEPLYLHHPLAIDT